MEMEDQEEALIQPGTSRLDHECNPMLNAVILQTLFDVGFISLKDFKNYRQVSKLWYSVSLEKWRSRTSVRLQFEDSDFKTYSIPSLSAKKLRDRVTLLPSEVDFFEFAKKPIKSVILDGGSNWDCRLTRNKLEFRVFWFTCGHSLTTLQLRDTSLWKMDALKNIIFKLTPNLKTLILENVNDTMARLARATALRNNEEYARKFQNMICTAPKYVQTNLRTLEITYCTLERFVISWLNLLARFPKLKNIKLRNIYRRRKHAEWASLFAAIKKINQDAAPGNKFELTSLDIINRKKYPARLGGKPISGTIVKSLCDLALPLTSLSIDLGYDCGPQVLIDILRAYDKLEKLSLRRGGWSTNWKTFPYDCLPSTLTSIMLYGPIFLSISFLRHTPNLQELKILTENDDILRDPNEIRLLEGVELPKMRHFEYFLRPVAPQIKVSIEGFDACLTCMPYLKSLRTQLNNHLFRVVCARLPELEDLTVFGEDLNDEGVSGISAGYSVRWPNVTDLKELRLFEMNPKSNKLGDTSVFEGFLKCPRLQKLTVTFSFMISDIAMKAIWDSSILDKGGIRVQHPSGVQTIEDDTGSEPESDYQSEGDSEPNINPDDDFLVDDDYDEDQE